MIVADLPIAVLVETRVSQSSPPSSSKNSQVTARTDSDTVSLSSAALQSLQKAHANESADQAADGVSFAAEHINVLSDMLNGIKQSLEPDNIQIFRKVYGDELTSKYVEAMNGKISGLEQSLSGWNKHIATNYDVVGSLPEKQEDGTWSQGSFSISSKGEGFEVRAESGGKTLMSKGGGPFVSWNYNDAAQGKLGTSDASIALQTLKAIKTIDYKA